MKKIWNFILKYRVYISILLLVMFLAFIFVTMKAYLNPDDPQAVYGSRLDGIESVKITDDKKEKVISFIKEDKTNTSANLIVKGKIIYIDIKTTTEDNTIDKMKEFSTKILENFTKEEIAFYDIQISINNVDGNYNLVGYKNKKNEDFSRVSDEIVKEVEDETKEG